MRRLAVGFVVLALLLVNASAYATIEGDTIAGTLNFGANTTNFFDPANGGVPAVNSGIQPAAVVTSADGAFVEFEYLNGFSGFHVDVDASTVSINQFLVGSPGRANNWDIWINDIDWSGGPGGIAGVSTISDTFTGGLGVAFTNNSLHFSFAGGQLNTGGATAVYQLTPIPEPSAVVVWSLLGVLGITIGCWRRRRSR